MFEGCLVESRGLVDSGTQRWTALGAATLQCALAGLLLAIPMVRPEALPMFMVAPRLVAPLPYKAPIVPVQHTSTATSSTAVSLPYAGAAPAAGRAFTFTRFSSMSDGPAPAIDTTLRMGTGGAGPWGGIDVGVGTMPAVTVAPARKPATPRISSGVSAGMLLAPIVPVYPAIAKAAGVQGAVVMEAMISKVGRIESLHAVSGPPMLRESALNAVAAARYEPYLLNGEPTEVQTVITVVFRLGS